MRFGVFYSSLRVQAQQIIRWSVEEHKDESGAVLYIYFKEKIKYFTQKSCFIWYQFYNG